MMTPELKDKIARLKRWASLATPYIEDDIMLIRDCEGHWAVECPTRDDLNFHAVSSPATILELIAEIEALEKEADWLAEAANEIGEHDEADIAWWREKARKAVRGKV